MTAGAGSVPSPKAAIGSTMLLGGRLLGGMLVGVSPRSIRRPVDGCDCAGAGAYGAGAATVAVTGVGCGAMGAGLAV